jgi:hypothetical protein
METTNNNLWSMVLKMPYDEYLGLIAIGTYEELSGLMLKNGFIGFRINKLNSNTLLSFSNFNILSSVPVNYQYHVN